MVNQVTIHTDQPKGTINRNIYGHFSEHLRRCIYEGFWVGDNSNIPNTAGIRNARYVAVLYRLWQSSRIRNALTQEMTVGQVVFN